MNFSNGNLRMRSSDGARHRMRSVCHVTSLHHIFTVSTPRIMWSHILLLSSQCLHVSFSSCVLLLLFSQCWHVASSSSYILLSSSSSWRCRHVNYFALTFYYFLHSVDMSHYLALTFFIIWGKTNGERSEPLYRLPYVRAKLCWNKDRIILEFSLQQTLKSALRSAHMWTFSFDKACLTNLWARNRESNCHQNKGR